jgi:prepilin-type processing-associated H-X9-DG protein
MGKYTVWDHCFELPADQSQGTRLLSEYLLGRGISIAGVRQLLAGNVVTNASDRQLLAQTVTQQLDIAAVENGRLEMGLLVPAVQKVRMASAGVNNEPLTLALERLGLSAAGAKQVLAGLPISNTDDRLLLAVPTSAAPRSRHTGGVNAMLMDGSVRY